MDLDEFQRQVAGWAARTFPNSSVRGKVLHLLEEAGELEEAERRGARDEIENEAADILIILLHYAESRGFSLMAAAKAKFDIVKARHWGPPDARGVVRRIKEP